MASKLPPVKAAAYTFSTALYAQADNEIKVTPTLAAGDVKVIKDGGAAANIASLPSETPASSGIVSVALSSSEMDADEVVVRFLDASGAEWWSQTHVIHTAAQTYDTIDTNVDSVLTDTGTTIPAQITGLNDPTAAAIRAEIDSNSTQLAAIVADTNELQGDWVNGGRLDLLIDAILEDTGTTLPASISGLNNLSAAQVNAEVVDALNTDTYAEPTGTPGATVTLAAKINWLYKYWRNKKAQTADTATLYNDDGTTADITSTVADDGTTATKGEWSA